jgi:WhiB family redox-sensing transcriptional regulator
MTYDKLRIDRITLDLHEAIIDNGGVECEQVPDIFFPEDLSTPGQSHMRNMATETAREICLRCPVMAKCLEVGMFEDFGIWGGATPEQRKRLKRQPVN